MYGGILPPQEAHILEPHALALLLGPRPSMFASLRSSVSLRVACFRLASLHVRSLRGCCPLSDAPAISKIFET